MKIPVQRWLLPLFVFLNISQGATLHPAEITNVNVVPNGEQLKVEIRLTGDVDPRVVTAYYPDRLVLELPNTTTNAKQRRIAVGRAGVKDLRIGLNSVAPLLTRLVIDLDHARGFDLAKVGNMVTLTVLPAAVSPGAPGNDLSASSNAEKRITLVPAANRRMRMGFKVKYVAEGTVYLDGGSAAGLAEGMVLRVRGTGRGGRLAPADEDLNAVADLRVIGVARTSAVTEVGGAKRSIRPGDWAYLSAEDTDALAENKRQGTRGRPTTQASGNSVAGVLDNSLLRAKVDPFDEGRVRARVGLDYSGISSHGLTMGNSSQIGLSVRTDITRIGGSYWNLNGYWRGRITSKSRTGEDTLRDVLNKTYTMQLSYDNPNSNWVAGFGRLYLPWANSLDTIDGGYVGRKVASGVTAGVFAGSTPDPASWHYNPDRQIGGAFVNFEGGSFDSFHYTSTVGVAASSLKWQLDLPFVFLENGISYKDTVSLYHSFILDSPQGVTTNGITPGTGISRSYLTVHYQPYQRVSFDFYHNYFRDVPTASTQLVGTGLVDKLLYQGTSVGVRVEPVRHLFWYGTVGHSDKTGDKEGTLNWMQGVTLDEIGRTGFRADFRYSRFDSTFASGNYKVLTLSRHLGDRMMWDTQVGTQNFTSPFTANTRNWFADTSLDMNLGQHSYFQSGYTMVRGGPTNYNQWYLSLGWRFDKKTGGDGKR